MFTISVTISKIYPAQIITNLTNYFTKFVENIESRAKYNFTTSSTDHSLHHAVVDFAFMNKKDEIRRSQTQIRELQKN